MMGHDAENRWRYFNRLDHYMICCDCMFDKRWELPVACSLTPVNNCGFQHETSFLFLWISIAVACGLICIMAHLTSPKLVGTTPAPYQYLTHLSFLLNPSKWLTHYVGQRYINVLFFLNGPSELKKEIKKEKNKAVWKQCGPFM